MMIRTNVKAQKKRNVRKRILTILIPMMIRKNVKAIKIRIVEKKILIILILMKKKSQNNARFQKLREFLVDINM
jgi:hypothetical protein